MVHLYTLYNYVKITIGGVTVRHLVAYSCSCLECSWLLFWSAYLGTKTDLVTVDSIVTKCFFIQGTFSYRRKVYLFLIYVIIILFYAEISWNSRALCDPGMPKFFPTSPPVATETDSSTSEEPIPPAGGAEGLLPRYLRGWAAEVQPWSQF